MSKNNYAFVVGIGSRFSADESLMDITSKDAEYLGNHLSFLWGYSGDAEKSNAEYILRINSDLATREYILAELDSFIAKINDKKDAQTVIIYFSGHGVKKAINGKEELFLLCQDKKNESDNFESTKIEGSVLAEKLNMIESENGLLLLDCCYAGKIGDSKIELKDKPITKKNRVVISSSSGLTSSYLGSSMSLFTYCLLKTLYSDEIQLVKKNVVSLFDLAMTTREFVAFKDGVQRPMMLIPNVESTSNFTIVEYEKKPDLPKIIKRSFKVLRNGKEVNIKDIPYSPDFDYREKWIENLNVEVLNAEYIEAKNVSISKFDGKIISEKTIIINSNKEKEKLDKLEDKDRTLAITEYINKVKRDYLNEKVRQACEEKLLENLYIPLSFRLEEISKEQELSDYLDGWVRGEKNHDSFKNIAVLGEAGSGKSTFLKKYAYHRVEAIVDYQLDSLSPLFFLPFYLPFSDLIYSNIEFAEFLENEELFEKQIKEEFIDKFSLSQESLVEKYSSKAFKSFAENLIQNGKILFLLDAFDEIQQGTLKGKNTIFKSLKWLVSGNSNKAIISGRPTYMNTKQELESILNIPQKGTLPKSVYFKDLYLEVLNKDRIRAILSKYTNSDRQLDLYVEKIYKNPNLVKLCSNPLYLQFIGQIIHCKNIGSTLGKLTETIFSNLDISPYSLINEFIDARFTHEIEKTQIGKNDFNENQQKRLLIQLYQEIAIKIYSRHQLVTDDWKTVKYKDKLYLITQNELENIIVKNDFRKEDLSLLTSFFLKRIVGIKNNEIRYKFVHQLYMDFFLAFNIIENLKLEETKPNIDQEEREQTTDKSIFNSEEFIASPLLNEFYWSGDVINMVKHKLLALSNNTDNEIPPLLSYIKGETQAKKIHSNLKLWSKIKMLLILLGAWLCKNCILVAFGFPILFFGLNWPILALIAFGLFFPVLFLAFFMRMPNYGKAFDKLTGNEAQNYNFDAKMYKIAFELNQISLSKNLDTLYYHLTSKSYYLKKIFGEEKNRLLLNGLFFLKHNIFETTYKYIDIDNGGFVIGNFYDCTFEDVDFKNSQYYMVCFENCNLRNTDFSGLRFSRIAFTQIFIVREIILRLFYKGKEPQMEKKAFLLNFMGKTTMDAYTIKSIKQLIKKKKLKLGKHIILNDDLKEKFATIDP